METDHVISELCHNKVIYYKHIAKKIILGAMTWTCYIENRIIMRRIIMRLKCMYRKLPYNVKRYNEVEV